MMNDGDIYIDSEEDEVFFGNFNEKEKKLISKLDDPVWDSASEKQCTKSVLSNKDGVNSLMTRNDENRFLIREGSDNAAEKQLDVDARPFPDAAHSKNDINNSCDYEDEFHSIHSYNTSVELDHNYSYTIQKIDESILANPNGVVKADKDGGFLKVLSELVLVKAEADNKLESNKKVDACEKSTGDEDKENKYYSIPEIRVTEPTPEKACHISPSENITKTSLRKFRIVYNSPNLNGITSGKESVRAKSFTENQTNMRTSFKNSWFNNENVEDSFSKKTETRIESPKKSRGNSWPNPTEKCTNTIDVIDISDESFTEKIKNAGNGDEQVLIRKNTVSEKVQSKKSSQEENNEIILIDLDSLLKNEVEEQDNKSNKNNSKEDSILIDVEAPPLLESKQVNSIGKFEKFECSLDDLKLNENNVTNYNSTKKEDKLLLCFQKDVDEEIASGTKRENVLEDRMASAETKQSDVSLKMSPRVFEAFSKPREIPKKCRFSKEARKIVEALKISTVDDTLNFTIPEIDLEQVDTSFLSPQSVPDFSENIIEKEPEVVIAKPNETKTDVQPEESDECLVVDKRREEEKNSSLPESNINLSKCFSEKKIQPVILNDVKKCTNLNMSDKTPVSLKKGQICEKKGELSRIPVAGVKTSKIPASCLLTTKVGGPKLTPHKRINDDAKGIASKTPTGSAQKTSKFKNVASPISAYIHNRPTALVVNAKPQNRKNAFLNVGKSLINSNIPKKSDKTPKKELALPFVEYKSATPFKIEKRSESRLPRLTPTVERLIGTNSPRILKHKGRFYMKTPGKKETSNVDATITADPNEVSVLVSQVAQKSRAIK